MAREETGEPDSKTGRIQFEIKKCMLYRRHREFLKDDVTMQFMVPQFMVPERLRSRVLHAVHESLMSAHQGIKKTQDKISAVFYWPSMLNDVKAHVINCDLCSDELAKQGLTKAPLGHLPLYSVYVCALLGGVVCTPPGQKTTEFNVEIEDLLLNATKRSKNVILAGDFNIDLLKIN